MDNTCGRPGCDRKVYPVEAVVCLGKIWHKQCFRCDACGITLNMKTYKSDNMVPYCYTHYPRHAPPTLAKGSSDENIRQEGEPRSWVKGRIRAFESTPTQPITTQHHPVSEMSAAFVQKQPEESYSMRQSELKTFTVDEIENALNVQEEQRRLEPFTQQQVENFEETLVGTPVETADPPIVQKPEVAPRPPRTPATLQGGPTVAECDQLLSQWKDVIDEADHMVVNELFSRMPRQLDRLTKFKVALLALHDAAESLRSRVAHGVDPESSLVGKLANYQRSVANPALLRQWLSSKHDEASVFSRMLHDLGRFETVFDPNKQNEILRSEDAVLAFTFGRLTTTDSDVFVGLLEDCADGEDVATEVGADAIRDSWYKNHATVEALEDRIKTFVDFFAANQEEGSGTRHIITTERGRTAGQIEPGTIYLIHRGTKTVFQPPVMLTPPRILQGDNSVGARNIRLEWDPPISGARSVVAYRVYFIYAADDQCNPCEHSQEFTDVPLQCSGNVGNLNPETGFKFAVGPITQIGRGRRTPYSPVFKTIAPSYAAELVRSGACILVQPAEGRNPAWYLLPKMSVFESTPDRLRRYEVNPRSAVASERTIMVLGATGSGKTTLINGLINFIFGVRYSDPYRLLLIHEDTNRSQAHSQTKEITTYTINHHPLLRFGYTLSIIDTPGYGDTEGLDEDKRITRQVQKFFNMTGPYAMQQLHAIGFVAQASLARLTPTQRYISGSIQALFGKDIVNNIFPLLTFADDKEPQILKALREDGVPFERYFKFNSSVFTRSPKSTEAEAGSDVDQFDSLFWDMAATSFKNFVNELSKKQAVSLLLTKQVLDERSKLETNIEGLQLHIQEGLNKLALMEQELPMIVQFESKIKANKNYHEIVEVPKTRKVPFDEVGRYVTNCAKCSFTCHKNCAFSKDEDKAHCSAMTDGKCRICKLKCSWEQHYHRSYYYEDYVERERRTLSQLKKQYDEAHLGLSTRGNMLMGIVREYNNVQRTLLLDVTEVRRCLAKLDQIALKPDPLSTVEYIDLMIDSTKKEKTMNWKHRLEQLENARNSAIMVEQMRRQGMNYDPFKEREQKLLREGKNTGIDPFKELEQKLKKQSKGAGAVDLVKKFFNWN